MAERARPILKQVRPPNANSIVCVCYNDMTLQLKLQVNWRVSLNL